MNDAQDWLAGLTCGVSIETPLSVATSTAGGSKLPLHDTLVGTAAIAATASPGSQRDR
jgi:hypothetical protein